MFPLLASVGFLFGLYRKGGERMAKEDLRPVRTKEEAKKRGKAGGIASGKARREKKAFRETLEAILGMAMKGGNDVSVDDIQSFAEIEGRNISVQEAILVAQIQKALTGDTRAAEYVRDTIGENPSTKVEAEVVIPVFGGEDALEE
jgi:hypothetical protein